MSSQPLPPHGLQGVVRAIQRVGQLFRLSDAGLCRRLEAQSVTAADWKCTALNVTWKADGRPFW